MPLPPDQQTYYPTIQPTIRHGIYSRVFKRPLDLTLALIALVVLSPVLLVVAILVRLKLGGPVLFRQRRPGLNEEIFAMYKFRTMTNEKDANGELLPDACRLTSFGCFLRSTSLDELPELFNIIRGDMSIVGPRPLLVQYLPLYKDDQKRRHAVRPGLTGLAQVSGRNAIGWEERFALDSLYVSNVTFSKDLMIIVKTVGRVISREGVSSDSTETMELFQGNEPS